MGLGRVGNMIICIVTALFGLVVLGISGYLLAKLVDDHVLDWCDSGALLHDDKYCSIYRMYLAGCVLGVVAGLIGLLVGVIGVATHMGSGGAGGGHICVGILAIIAGALLLYVGTISLVKFGGLGEIKFADEDGYRDERNADGGLLVVYGIWCIIAGVLLFVL